MIPLELEALRPDNTAAECGPRFGEYPVAMLTKRTLGLRSEEVLTQRHSAPGQIRLGSCGRPRGPKPC